jgi:very-short-patch-repair endonuclease
MKPILPNNTAYNKRLQPFANRLRKEMTKSESCLWKYVLKSRKMYGYQFRRQRSVLGYIADFMCKELMLVIELDGATHLLEEVIEKDIKKQRTLENAGFTVMRFTDDEVLNSIENVADIIKEKIKELEFLKS